MFLLSLLLSPLSSESHRLVTLLESSQYLEQYLWPLFDPEQEPKANKLVLMSLVLMVNEKFRERVPAWKVHVHVPMYISLVIIMWFI